MSKIIASNYYFGLKESGDSTLYVGKASAPHTITCPGVPLAPGFISIAMSVALLVDAIGIDLLLKKVRRVLWSAELDAIKKEFEFFCFLLNTKFLLEYFFHYASLALHGHQQEVVEVGVKTGNIYR